jgi:hypothetical protein
MSVYIDLKQYPFYSLIMAAMRQADTDNVRKLQQEWPNVWAELEARYHAPGGLLDGEVGEERPPDSDFCSRCREHTGFEKDELGEWLSVCCSAPAMEQA